MQHRAEADAVGGDIGGLPAPWPAGLQPPDQGAFGLLGPPVSRAVTETPRGRRRVASSVSVPGPRPRAQSAQALAQRGVKRAWPLLAELQPDEIAGDGCGRASGCRSSPRPGCRRRRCAARPARWRRSRASRPRCGGGSPRPAAVPPRRPTPSRPGKSMTMPAWRMAGFIRRIGRGAKFGRPRRRRSRSGPAASLPGARHAMSVRWPRVGGTGGGPVAELHQRPGIRHAPHAMGQRAAADHHRRPAGDSRRADAGGPKAPRSTPARSIIASAAVAPSGRARPSAVRRMAQG